MIVYALRRAAPTAQGAYRQVAAAWCSSNERCRSFGTAPPLRKGKSDALRILFCGSDAFSCESLKALHAEHRRNRELVERLEVMVVPPKRVGRGFKQVREVPCKQLAEDLGLQLHQRETFRDWALPEGINLVVVVSFRLFVPKRILSSAKYGGLNVHPSLLPHLRGPAPIHHAVLRGEPFTGVSLQTLDPTAFDHGTVLAQTPAPGIPIPQDISLADMTHELAVQGGEMLVQGLRDGVHVPPLQDVGWMVPEGDGLVHAPKVTKADMQIDWHTARAEDVPRKLRVFGSLWTQGVVASGKNAGSKKRVLFTAAKQAEDEIVEASTSNGAINFVSDTGVEKRVSVKVDANSGVVYCRDDGGSWIGIVKAKVDGSAERDASSALRPFLQETQN